MIKKLLNQTDIEDILKVLDVELSNPSLLNIAFTHRSLFNEIDSKGLEHNERVEFLGDAVLDLGVTEFLYQNYTQSEGYLTSLRAGIVRTESLAQVAKNLGIGKFLMMSKGEEQTGGNERIANLANLFEAIIGVIYLDKGYTEAKYFIAKNLLEDMERIEGSLVELDPKSKLQEIVQQKFGQTPQYNLTGDEGPDHNKTFTMSVGLSGQVFGVGTGSSKHQAASVAALNAIEKLSQ